MTGKFLLISFSIILFSCFSIQAQDLECSGNQKSVLPAIFSSNETPWEELGNGTRRKVFFNDRLTFVILEINRPVDEHAELVVHSHTHDQITYLQEGKLLVKTGDIEKEIEEGGIYIIPSNVPHGIKVLSEKVVLIDVFTPTREDFRHEKEKNQ